MKGLPNSPRSSNCFSNGYPDSVRTRVARRFKKILMSTEYPTEKEKQPYRHVPTHAGRDFLRTTTTPAMRRADEMAQSERLNRELQIQKD
jgi:hypothetical protein